eukprot:ANDGO_07259.mRNA.1 hypothetical protein
MVLSTFSEDENLFALFESIYEDDTLTLSQLIEKVQLLEYRSIILQFLFDFLSKKVTGFPLSIPVLSVFRSRTLSLLKGRGLKCLYEEDIEKSYQSTWSNFPEISKKCFLDLTNRELGCVIGLSSYSITEYGKWVSRCVSDNGYVLFGFLFDLSENGDHLSITFDCAEDYNDKDLRAMFHDLWKRCFQVDYVPHLTITPRQTLYQNVVQSTIQQLSNNMQTLQSLEDCKNAWDVMYQFGKGNLDRHLDILNVVIWVIMRSSWVRKDKLELVDIAIQDFGFARLIEKHSDLNDLLWLTFDDEKKPKIPWDLTVDQVLSRVDTRGFEMLASDMQCFRDSIKEMRKNGRNVLSEVFNHAKWSDREKFIATRTLKTAGFYFTNEQTKLFERYRKAFSESV